MARDKQDSPTIVGGMNEHFDPVGHRAWSHHMRRWYIDSALAFQSIDVGLIPTRRSKFAIVAQTTVPATRTGGDVGLNPSNSTT